MHLVVALYKYIELNSYHFKQGHLNSHVEYGIIS